MTGAGSFEAFVAERSTALLRTAYLLTGDRGPALDLLQTALVAVHRRWDRMADDAAATAAVRREMVAAQAGWLRRIWIGDLLAEGTLLAGTAGLPGFGPRPAEPGPRDEVTAALLQLPPRMRAALVLRHGEGLSESAAADALGGPVEQARTLSSLGARRLWELLAGTCAAAPDDDALAGRLRSTLAVRAADVAAAPDDTLAGVLDAARARRRHVGGLAALSAFLVLTLAVVVVATIG